MKKRMLELMEYPCSAAFLADVMQVGEDEVKAELAKMERRGKIKKTVVYSVKEGEEQCAA
ncbi:Uncharacterised protein [Neisseria zoodegmatis]|uniref:Uncharacterized protein n=1 Tax=Neisseria zoodegmatis TaxID=326523 RepID=A0A378WIA3_9NEIS|nr:hypothetical protein [Neisseria zoodegmatis]SUA36331.1 Uncharacterised protein [Neisseria zoodegmatis]